MTKNKKHGQAVRKTNQKSTQGRKTANKPIKSNKSLHKSTKNTSTAKTAQNKPNNACKNKKVDLTKHHPRFPFWARFLGDRRKHRTTLIVDEESVKDKKTNQLVDGFVHREATSQYKADREKIDPNPDKDKRPDPMYLKRATKAPKTEFVPHNKNLSMPKRLKEQYDKNNNKDTKE